MYTLNSRIRYSEVDREGFLTMTGLTNYFQDCSTFQSEDLNIGLSYLNKNNRAWILTSWQIVVERFPQLGEHVTVGTWASKFNGLYGNRNFILKDSNDQTCAYANSIWIYMDMNRLRPVRLTNEITSPYSIEPPYPMNYENRKITVPADCQTQTVIPVLPSYIDTNNHMNNGQYIRIAESFLPNDFPIRQMRAEYKNSAHLGDLLVPKISQEDSLFTVILANKEGKIYATVEFKERKHI
ncbi:acyl-[acyl-carrier-protein] thioesterase [Velocimicrobium porci]|uniref:Acyl-[acyl-carrier-protein] thioesterase n=1 Tax=Velocimicrobium porci TaxID=2606634 RepID=A0A6L5XZT4_9FIRM|nr:acyl-ACP thioesterase domain-containing protein [Velocimicrobium porci]MSS64224.1 acyl-[acyl-carrier-protein] thioesterase [Velocimicrobium porci]